MAESSTPAAPSASPVVTALQNALPGIFGRANVVISPYPFATQDDDRLRITVVNALPGVTVNVHGRLVTRKGEAKPFRYPMTPASDRSVSSTDFPLSGGFVSNLTAFASGATPTIGQTFVIVQIVRGAGAAAFILGTLLANAVTASQPIGWPGTPIVNSIDTDGYIRTIHGTQPASGSEIKETVPAGARWEVLSMNLTMTLSAIPADRKFQLFFRSAGFVPCVNTFFTDATASEIHNFLFSRGVTYLNDRQQSNGHWPTYLPIAFPVFLSAGDDFETLTDLIQNGDQWAAPTYQVREWLDF
ncbi:MAG: hypothetical protein LAO77_23210 [Acidobacteriia bacterium]|nr:hypothetical protein [Terriglobia bacterium]